MNQKVISSKDNYNELDQWLDNRKVLLVCGNSMNQLPIYTHLKKRVMEGSQIVRFSDFQPNPSYESVEKGVILFHQKGCDAVMVVGGGSAMDVAKCIKLFSNMDISGNYLEQTIVPNNIPILAMPTTAGSGSEATRYAVIYYNGEKQSISDESCIPETVLIDGSVLHTLPLYQKKATMMDALCHAMESYWSVNSTKESKEYSRQAIQSILANKEGYLSGTERGQNGMLLAANMAGKAINITQTTAGHAMCYKITGLFGIAHGHAAALCVRVLFPWMVKNTDKCADPRGVEYLNRILSEISAAMGCSSTEEGCFMVETIVKELELNIPAATTKQFEILVSSVNPIRLKNHPIILQKETIDKLYHEILGEA